MVSYGVSNTAKSQPFQCTDAVTYAGSLVTLSTTVGNDVALADGNASDVVHGYTFATTKNPITGTAEANKMVGICGLVPGDEVYLPLCTDNGAITIGLGITVCNDAAQPGLADTVTITSLTTVAYALEAVDASAGGSAKCRIA